MLDRVIEGPSDHRTLTRIFTLTLETPSTAGIESTAKTKSESSMQIRHMNIGVASVRPSTCIHKVKVRGPPMHLRQFWSSYACVTSTHLGEEPVSVVVLDRGDELADHLHHHVLRQVLIASFVGEQQLGCRGQ